MIRFYEGFVYDVRLAVWPDEKGVDYHILRTREWDGRAAFLKCGFDRELRVNEHTMLVLERGKKRKVMRIPFVKEEGRLVCDLPEFLKQLGISYTLYKRPQRNCGGCAWDSISHSECVSKNGELWWGSDWHIDWREYWIGIQYNANFPVIDGKKVLRIRFWSEGHKAEAEETLAWFKQTMEEQVTMSWKEFGVEIDHLGLRKDSPFLIITFCDGSEVKGNQVDWIGEEEGYEQQ